MPSLASLLPCSRWPAVWRQEPGSLRRDILAGLTVGLVLVPQSMAYAKLAGMPPVTGLYAATIPTMLGALFGRCGQLNTGPVAMTCLLTASALGSLGLTATLADGVANPAWLAAAALLALLVAAVRLLAASLHAAVAVALLSHPAVIGFTTAAGLVIAATQVPDFLGLAKGSHANPIVADVLLLGRLAEAHLPTVAMGVGSLAAMVMLKRWAPRLPGLLSAMAGATVVAWLTGYAGSGGRVVGALPAGLPAVDLSHLPWSNTFALLPGALAVAVIGLLEVLTVTTTAAARTRQQTDLNGELVGQGLASAAAGLLDGFPVSGSLSRSALTLNEGARTGLAGLVSGLLVLSVLLLATDLLHHLPYAALAAAVMVAVASLVRPAEILRIARVSRADGLCAAVTLLLSLALAPDLVSGMLLGAAVAWAVFILRTMSPAISVRSRLRDGRWRSASTPAADDEVLCVRMDARLYFANALHLERHLVQCLEGRPALRLLALDASGINDLDATGATALARVAGLLQQSGVRLILCGLRPRVRTVLDRAGVSAALGAAAFASDPDRLETPGDGATDQWSI